MDRQSPDLFTVARILGEIRPLSRPEGRRLENAVVFLLLFDAENPRLLAVLKSDNEGYPWRNQVALPGGHIDKRDATPLDAAFRELKEEVHIRRGEVRFIGTLGYFQTINNKNIEVFSGIWAGRQTIGFDKAEIARILKIPLSLLFRIHMERGYHGRFPEVHELVYPVEDVRIWGVTGKILHFLLERLHPAFTERR